MATLSRWHSGFEVGKVSAAEYDLVVVGSGPAGQKGAIAAAKAHKRVALMLAALDGAE
jgi:succinate dehydrogenase/fumarate reductase flavoprotein subunit